MLLTVSFLPSALGGWGDFRQLYTGGYMVRVGERNNFYDYDTQLKYEHSLVPIPTHLPANHMAYEHLLFAPLSLLIYRTAYLVFFALNIALVALILHRDLAASERVLAGYALFALFAQFYIQASWWCWRGWGLR